MFDAKTTQIITFAAFLTIGQEAGPRNHAIAARRAGATWEELHMAAELACSVAGFGMLALADKIIADLQAQEATRPGDAAQQEERAN